MTSKRDLARYRKLQKIGCMACRELFHPGVPGDIHHIVDKGYRKHSGGNKATIVLCPYHHRGHLDPDNFMFKGAYLMMKQAIGPSLADGAKVFEKRFGTQRELLAKADALLTCGKRGEL